MTENNRRRHARVKPKQLVTRVRSGEDLHIGLGIENISMGGLFVRHNAPPTVGKIVTLELLRPGASQPLAITGKVTSSITVAQAVEQDRAAGMGIAFDPMPPHVQQRLEGLIGAIDPKAIDPLHRPGPGPGPAQAIPPGLAKSAAGKAGDRTELVAAFAPRSNEQLAKEITALKAELAERNRKIEELLRENKSLWQRIRTMEG